MDSLELAPEDGFDLSTCRSGGDHKSAANGVGIDEVARFDRGEARFTRGMTTGYGGITIIYHAFVDQALLRCEILSEVVLSPALQRVRVTRRKVSSS
jgi:hypothetical protein